VPLPDDRDDVLLGVHIAEADQVSVAPDLEQRVDTFASDDPRRFVKHGNLPLQHELVRCYPDSELARRSRMSLVVRAWECRRPFQRRCDFQPEPSPQTARRARRSLHETRKPRRTPRFAAQTHRSPARLLTARPFFAADDVIETPGPIYQPGDRIEYIAQPVFDCIITTGEIGIVVRIEDDWVFAEWPRSGVHSVPVSNTRPASRTQDR
jgi:hypothetical protein